MLKGFTRRGAHAQQRWPLSVLAIAAATGFVFVMAAINANGDDLRPSGGDLSSLLQDRSRDVDSRQREARELRSEVDRLSKGVSTGPIDAFQQTAESLRDTVGLSDVKGPGVTVVLSDAPRSAQKPGLDPNLLVVHEQDIQAYVNALWAGGAEAISLQGQRLISTTGIKCVGNTVLLDGVPYAPPYRIEAVGDVVGMVTSLNTTPETVTYADYSREHQLGLEVGTQTEITVPAYAGTISLSHARAVADD